MDVAAVQRAYHSEAPNRQFRDNGASANFILKQPQHSVLHQVLRVGPGFGGNLRKLRFLLGGEVYFHVVKIREKPL